MKYPTQLESDHRGERWRIRGDTIMAGVHNQADCQPPCVLHAPTDHPMRSWKLIWRPDRHIFERMCPHGIGHPDPDDQDSYKVHGCDGCCVGLEGAYEIP